MPPRAKITKVLIANRGEIACRVIRACRELDMRTVAVYSEADARRLHVRLADEAVSIGPPPARESYLDIDKILDAHPQDGADGVHPGYGFLSENADFAEAVARGGRDLHRAAAGGDPARWAARPRRARACRRRACRWCRATTAPAGAGFPDAAAAKAAAARVGYPVMLKAAAGGGGRGMRLVDSEDKLEAALAGAQREAKAAFGDDTVYLEKAIVRPRHIEIQVFGDEHGGAVHLYERDCSIQRRNQKVIEESPSPAIDDETRARDGRGGGARRALGRLRRRRHHRDALRLGGAQLLLPGDEHPAAGRAPDHRVGDRRRSGALAAGGRPGRAGFRWRRRRFRGGGAAIECRVYAEDSVKFLPSPGTITSLRVPAGPGDPRRLGRGRGQRRLGPLRPDDLQAAAPGPTRAPAAIDRMRRALGEYHVGGIKTNLAVPPPGDAPPGFPRRRATTPGSSSATRPS